MDTSGGPASVVCENCGDKVEFYVGSSYSRAMLDWLSDRRKFLCRSCKHDFCEFCLSQLMHSDKKDKEFCPFCDTK